MSTTRPAAVAGTFYPESPSVLRETIQELYDNAADQPAVGKVIIAPHAGYIYSGPIAASAYAPLLKRRDEIKRVILLGPAHYVGLSGIALPSDNYFETPLGKIEIDREAKDLALNHQDVIEFDQTHQQEHSLETHLPFLQQSLHNFTLLPLVVGNCNPESLAQLICSLWGGKETLIIISTDLSHFKNYDDANACDMNTVQKISALNLNFDHYDACGSGPLKGFILAAGKQNIKPKLIDLRNSGDTSGSKDKVVGYASFICDSKENLKAVLSIKEQQGLIDLARHTIASKLGVVLPKPNLESMENADIATFVTLKINGELRGCIGTLVAHRTLVEDIKGNAISAAFRDPRFSPLCKEEFNNLEISISLLTEPEDIHFSNEDELLSKIRPGIDGLILSTATNRGTFLPSVWEDLPEKSLFWQHLKRKAGLPVDFWSPDIVVQRYTSVYITE